MHGKDPRQAYGPSDSWTSGPQGKDGTKQELWDFVNSFEKITGHTHGFSKGLPVLVQESERWQDKRSISSSSGDSAVVPCVDSN